MTKWIIILLSLIIFSCSDNKNKMQADYSMELNVSYPEKLLFKGTINISTNNDFRLKGHDYIKWPWQDTIKPIYHEQTGSIFYNKNRVEVKSDNRKEGGWQFDGDYDYFSFKDRVKAKDFIKNLPDKTQYYYFENIDSQEIIILKGETF